VGDRGSASVEDRVEELERPRRVAHLVGDRPVDEHEHHAHRLIGAVGPGVVGGALHDGVARANPRLGTVVEQQPGLAVEPMPTSSVAVRCIGDCAPGAISVYRIITPLAGGGTRIGRAVGSDSSAGIRTGMPSVTQIS
jgi:hypothetical protein